MIEAPQALVPFLSARDRLVAGGWEAGAERRLAELMSSAVVELAGSDLSGVAVVATGGFGRGLMAIRSDVDLMFLHGGSEPAELIRRVLRPLWDASLKVGHLTHTPKGARVFAGTRLDALSTFLSARFLCGDESLFDEFRERFRGLLEKEHSRIIKGMAAEEIQRREAEPFRLMSADLKVERGGIRTLDMLDWRRRILDAHGAPVPEVDPREPSAREVLTRVRSALHVAAGRAFDRYDFELRLPAADWLGMSTPELGRMLLEARSDAEDLVDLMWHEVSGGSQPRVESPRDVLEMSKPGRGWDWVRAARRGRFPEALADVSRLIDEPHLVAFHRYPVGEHTLAAVHLAWELFEGVDDAIAWEAVQQVAKPEPLIWATLLHDIGKGLEGDHAWVGSQLVYPVVEWAGLDPEDARLVERLVEDHLLLADLATKLDADDPAVLTRVADRVVDVRTLQYLYLLTMVDSRATGSDTWSPWRAELLRRAFRRLERELVRRAIPEETRVEVLADEILKIDGGELTKEEVVSHLAGFGEVYRRGHTPEEIQGHLMLARSPNLAGTSVTVIPGSPARVLVMTTDRARLLTDVAGVLAINRFSIVDARFATRFDGRVFDTFEVRDAAGGSVPTASRLEKVEKELERVLRGGFDVEGPLAKKQEAYRSTDRSGVPPVVRIRRLSDGGGVVEVECADRLGLLHDLGLVIHSYQMAINRARVDTRDGVAYDTFFVSRLPADPAPFESDLKSACGL